MFERLSAGVWYFLEEFIIQNINVGYNFITILLNNFNYLIINNLPPPPFS
jgi:hypothetical protein